MNKHHVTADLVKSEKWRQFLESTAAALQINLVFSASGEDGQFSACNKCPVCLRELPPLAPTRMADTKAQAKCLLCAHEDYMIAARDYPCCTIGDSVSFEDKINVAETLLNHCCDIFKTGSDSDRISVKPMALHEMSRMMLSMLRGNQNSLERVLNLILSAAVILFDAEGCWLEYADEQQHFLMKGNCNLASDRAALYKRDDIIYEIYSPVIHGALGIIAPADLGRAYSFLDSFIRDCILIFETDKLLRLMGTKQSLVLDNVDTMVLLADRRNKICYANTAASRLLECPIHELITRPIHDIDAPWRMCICSETGEAEKGTKARLLCASGARVVDWGAYPLTRGGEVSGWLITATDRTDYYHLQELVERSENLVQASTLLRVIAHEIRNPLATFSGLLQIIDIKSGAAEISRYVNVGMNEIRKISLLLDEFSQFGKEAAISLEETDLKPLMEEVFSLVTTGFNGPDIEITASISTVKPVLADRRQLTQAIFNLVKNADEALGHRGRIALSLSQYDRDCVEIKVCDNGPGISDNIKDKLFKPYVTTKPDGTGLGLAIANSIVSNHNGKLSVQNLADGGACFSIHLPVCASKEQRNQNVINILIISHDALIRLPSERLFKAEGISYYLINRNESVVALIEKYRPSAVLLDESYFSLNILNKIICNITTDFPDTQFMIVGDRVRETGGNAFYIRKPLTEAKLIGIVQSLLK